MRRFEFLEDVVGVNTSGVTCHPYKGLVGAKKGKFSFTLKTDDNKDFKSATAEELIELIEAGAFDLRGRIRMLPADSQHSKSNSALSVISYKGQRLPLKHGLSSAAADRDLGAMETKNRLPAEQLRKVTPEYIWEAVQTLLHGTPVHGYRPSTDYDLLVNDDVRLPPKQVFGLAATAALGKDVKPVHFTGGLDTVCFELLEAAGYKIVPKDEQLEAEVIPADTEGKEWVEGQPKLVSHLRRERAPGLSQAKKAAFIKVHGRLFCESCLIDPLEIYGDLGAACIEVHHDAIQVADMGEEHKTTLDELRCLCANCHRIVHRQLKLQILQSSTESQNHIVPFSGAIT